MAGELGSPPQMPGSTSGPFLALSNSEGQTTLGPEFAGWISVSDPVFLLREVEPRSPRQQQLGPEVIWAP